MGTLQSDIIKTENNELFKKCREILMYEIFAAKVVEDRESINNILNSTQRDFYKYKLDKFPDIVRVYEDPRIPHLFGQYIKNGFQPQYALRRAIDDIDTFDYHIKTLND